MTLNEFEEAIAEIKRQNPDAGNMDIGPVFWSGGENVILYLDAVTLEPTAGLNKTPAIGIHWSL
jgi:hypothetical protein